MSRAVRRQKTAAPKERPANRSSNPFGARTAAPTRGQRSAAVQTAQIEGSEYALPTQADQLKATGNLVVLVKPQGVDTNGWIAEIAYIPFVTSFSPGWPWLNTRIGLQYTWYEKVNGVTAGASNNNTLFAYIWLAM